MSALIVLMLVRPSWDGFAIRSHAFSGTQVVLAAMVLTLIFMAVFAAWRERVEQPASHVASVQNQLALEAGRLGWWHWTPTASVLFWSDEMGPLYGRPVGWQPEDGNGLSLVHRDDRERVVEQFGEAIADGAGAIAPWRVVWPSGEVRWLEGNLRVDAGDSRAPRSVTGVVRDVTDLVTVSEAAQRAEAYLRGVLQVMGDGVIVREAANFSATLTNAAAAEILGVAQEELTEAREWGSRWTLHDDLGRPVDQQMTAGQRALDSGTPQTAFYHVKRPDGLWRWVQVRAVPLEASAGHKRAVLLTLSDLSEVRSLQRRLEQQTEELRAQNEELAFQNDRQFLAESRFRGVLTAMHEGVLLHAPDGQLILSNPAAKRVLGMDFFHHPQGVLGDGVFAALRVDGTPLPPEEHPTRLALQCGKATRDVVLGVDRPDGSRVWLQVSAVPVVTNNRPTVIVTTLTDITALRRTEHELAEREAHYRLIATGTRDMVTLTRVDGTVEWASPSARAVLGCNESELIGTRLSALSDPESAADSRSELAQGHTPETVQHRLRRADGGYIWAESSYTPVPNIDGSLGGYLCVTRDVSERHELSQRLSQSERLRAVGTLAGGLAHDFNNVLAVVRVTAESLVDQQADMHMQDELRTILNATDRAQSLTRQMLTFARRQVTIPVVSGIDDIVRAGLPLFQHLIRPPLSMDVMLDAENASVRVDPDELTTAVMNVLSNAADAMPAGGKVVLRTDVVALAAPHIADLAPGRYVRLAVQDTGEGMSEDVRSRALEPFFTTKALGKGTGLGLATVFGVVKHAGGSVTIDSTVGSGTVISILLPLIAEKSVAIPHLPNIVAAAVPKSLRILVVDDDLALCRVLGRSTRVRGHHVDEVHSVEEALAFLEMHAERVDVVITDHLMPGQTGRCLIEQVRQRWPHVRCALISGFTDDEHTSQWLEHAAVPFLHKPFTLHSLDTLLSVLATTRGESRRLIPAD